MRCQKHSGDYADIVSIKGCLVCFAESVEQLKEEHAALRTKLTAAEGLIDFIKGKTDKIKLHRNGETITAESLRCKAEGGPN